MCLTRLLDCDLIAFMPAFGDILKELRSHAGWNQEFLARKVGISREQIARLETQRNMPQPGTYRRIAEAFGLTLDELDQQWRASRIEQYRGTLERKAPVINKAPAGQAQDYSDLDMDNGIGYDYVSTVGTGIDDPLVFAFEVVGDSMLPAFAPGEVCLCSPNTPIEDGDAVYVRFGSECDHECTFKRVYDLQDGRVELRADNTLYKPMIVSKQHIVRMSYVAAKITRFDRRKHGGF